MTPQELEAAIHNLESSIASVQRDVDELHVVLGEIAEYAADRLSANR